MTDPLAVEAAARKAARDELPTTPYTDIMAAGFNIGWDAHAAYGQANSQPGKLGQDPGEPTAVGGEARQEDGGMKRAQRLFEDILVEADNGTWAVVEDFARQGASICAALAARPVIPERNRLVVRRTDDGLRVSFEDPPAVIPEREAGGFNKGWDAAMGWARAEFERLGVTPKPVSSSPDEQLRCQSADTTQWTPPAASPDEGER